MKPTVDDPQWTAYVLGDLTPQEQREAEQHLAENPELKREVEALRQTVLLVKDSLGATQSGKSAPPISLETIEPAAIPRPPRPSTFKNWIPTLAAACLAIALGAGWFLATPSHPPVAESAESGVEPANDAEESPQRSEPRDPSRADSAFSASAPLSSAAAPPENLPAPSIRQRMQKRQFMEADTVGGDDAPAAWGRGMGYLQEDQPEEPQAELELMDVLDESVPGPTPTPTPTPTPRPETEDEKPPVE